MDLDAFLQLSPEALRERIPALATEPVNDASLAPVISAELAELLASWSDSEIASVLCAVAGVGVERRLYTAHPLLRQAARIWSGHVLAGSTLEGVEHLSEAAAAGPTAVVCNHRSYIDSSAIDTILFGHMLDELADRLPHGCKRGRFQKSNIIKTITDRPFVKILMFHLGIIDVSVFKVDASVNSPTVEKINRSSNPETPQLLRGSVKISAAVISIGVGPLMVVTSKKLHFLNPRIFLVHVKVTKALEIFTPVTWSAFCGDLCSNLKVRLVSSSHMGFLRNSLWKVWHTRACSSR